MPGIFQSGLPRGRGEFDGALSLIGGEWVDERPSTDDPAVISELLRGYVNKVLAIRASFHAGECFEPLRAIQEDALELAEILQGHDPAYAAPDRKRLRELRWTLTVLVPVETRHYGNPFAAILMWLAAQTSEASAAVEQGVDDAVVFEELDRIVRDVVGRLAPAVH
jgi:hypothetical protein